MKTIKREHRNAVRMSKKDVQNTTFVRDENHPLGGNLQLQVREDEGAYYFLSYGRWGNATRVSKEEMKGGEAKGMNEQEIKNYYGEDIV